MYAPLHAALSPAPIGVPDYSSIGSLSGLVGFNALGTGNLADMQALSAAQVSLANFGMAGLSGLTSNGSPRKRVRVRAGCLRCGGLARHPARSSPARWPLCCRGHRVALSLLAQCHHVLAGLLCSLAQRVPHAEQAAPVCRGAQGARGQMRCLLCWHGFNCKPA